MTTDRKLALSALGIFIALAILAAAAGVALGDDLIMTGPRVDITWPPSTASDIRDYGVWITQEAAGLNWRLIGRTADTYFTWNVPLEDQEQVYYAGITARDLSWPGGNELAPPARDLARSTAFRPDGIAPPLMPPPEVQGYLRQITIHPDGTITIDIN